MTLAFDFLLLVFHNLLSLVTKPEIVFENKMLDKYAHAIPRCMHLCKMFVLFDIETILFTFLLIHL